MRVTIQTEANRTRILSAVSSLPLGGLWVVEIKEVKSTRTLAQNRTLWGWYTVIKKHIGESTGEYFSEEDLHEHFVRKFLPCSVAEAAGEIIVRRTKTSKLGTAKMAEYMDFLDRYCVEHLKLWLPQPGGPEE